MTLLECVVPCIVITDAEDGEEGNEPSPKQRRIEGENEGDEVMGNMGFYS